MTADLAATVTTPPPHPRADAAFWRAAAARRDARPCPPWTSEEIAVVRAANAAAGAPPEALAAIEDLARPETLLVVTGQQAGLWLGPLYTLYKALAAVKWARRIEELLERPVRAAFWIASEDHDFEEVRHAHYLSREGELKRWTYAPGAEPAAGTSVCDVAFEREALLGFLDEVGRETLEPQRPTPPGEKGAEAGQAGRPHHNADRDVEAGQAGRPHHNECREAVLGRWRRHVEASEDLEGLFARELLDLLGAMGLFFVTPRMAPIRRRAKGVLGREIAAAGESTRRVVEAAHRLEAAGKVAPVHRRGDEANFFVYREGRRCKVTVEVSQPGAAVPHAGEESQPGATVPQVGEDSQPGATVPQVVCDCGTVALGCDPLDKPGGDALDKPGGEALDRPGGGTLTNPGQRFFLIHDPEGKSEPERISAVALLGELEAAPEHFSPNVLTRPLVQDAALPVIAYVGGPGEVRYLAQSADAGLPEFFGVAASVVLTRPRALLLEPRAERRLRHFGIDEAVLAREDWATFDVPLARVGSAGAAQDAIGVLRLEAREAMRRLGARLGALAERPAVVSAIEKTEKSVMGAADALEGRLRAEAARVDEAETAHARRLRAAVHPEGSPQERVLGVLAPFLVQHGPGLATWIEERLDLDGGGVAVMRLGKMERKDTKDPKDIRDEKDQ